MGRLDEVSAQPLPYPFWHQAKTSGGRLSPADLTLLARHIQELTRSLCMIEPSGRSRATSSPATAYADLARTPTSDDLAQCCWR